MNQTIEKSAPPKFVDPAYFFLVSGLLYPGALGAALNWFVEGTMQYVRVLRHGDRSRADAPNEIALAMALWFVLYHAFWFARLLKRHGGDPKYEPRALASDVIDCLAILSGFAALGFLRAPLITSSHEQFVFLYLSVLAIPVAVCVAHGMEMSGARQALTFVTMGVAVAGALTNAALHDVVYNGTILIILWVLLIIHLVAVARGWSE